MPLTETVSSLDWNRELLSSPLSVLDHEAMSNFRGVWINVLDGAIGAGRAAMRELEEREIPSGVRRVAAYSGGKLPPPLASSLLAEIDENEWFREKVTEQFAGDDESPSALFLHRPNGWWMGVVEAIAAAGLSHGEGRAADLQRQLDKTEAKLRTVNAKLTEQRKEADDERRRAREAVEATRNSVAARFETERAEMEAARQHSTALAKRVAELETEHLALQDAFATLRSRFAKARRYRVADSSAETGAGSLPSNPVKLARLLDLQTASFGRTPRTEVPVTAKDIVTLRLDAGVRPDSADGIRWLLGLAEPVVVLVDGYNAQFHIDRRDFTSGAARRTLVNALRRLRDAATVKHRVVVVFDSTLPGERIPRSSLGGVEIRFTEKDVIADEEIIDLVADLDRVVVISSDREVREEAETGGAVVLWSESLAEWLARL